jgi:hypothetical protein
MLSGQTEKIKKKCQKISPVSHNYVEIAIALSASGGGY